MNQATASTDPDYAVVAFGHVMGRTSLAATYQFAADYLFNEPLYVRERSGEWAAVSRPGDSDIAWIPARAITAPRIAKGPLLVCIARGSHGYIQPDIRYPAFPATMGTRITSVATKTVAAPNGIDRVELVQDVSGYWFPAAHFATWPSLTGIEDLATKFVGVPYLYKGRSSEGVDEFGLIQVCLTTTNRNPVFHESGLGSILQCIQSPSQPMQKNDIVWFDNIYGVITADGYVIYSCDQAAAVIAQPLESALEHRKKLLTDMKCWRKA